MQKSSSLRLIPLIVVGICFGIVAGIFIGIRYLFIVLFVRLMFWIQHIDGILLYSQHPAWGEWSEELAKNNRLISLIWHERKVWNLSPATLLLYATARSHSSLKKDQENSRKDIYPSAVVFGSSFFPTTIRFAQAWQRTFKGDETVLKAHITLLRDRLGN